MNPRIKHWSLLSICYVLAATMTIFEAGWTARVYKIGMSVSQLRMEIVIFVILTGPILLLIFILFAVAFAMCDQTSGGCGSCSFEHHKRRRFNYWVLGYWTAANIAAVLISAYRFTTSRSQVCAPYAEFDPTCHVTTIASFMGVPAAFFVALALWIVHRDHRAEKAHHTDLESGQRLQINSQPRERQAMSWAMANGRECNPDFSRKPDDLTWSQADYTVGPSMQEGKGAKEEDMHVVPLTPR